jgi:TonB family protein
MKFDFRLAVIGLLTIIVIITTGSIVYLYFRLETLETRNNQLSQALIGAQSNSNNPRGNRDSYLGKQVKNTIVKNSKQVLACYDAYLKRISNDQKSDLPRDGNITMDWQIEKNGQVVAPGIVRSTFKNPVFEQALIDTVGNWTFPPPPSGMNKYVEHTFRFQDAESGKEK